MIRSTANKEAMKDKKGVAYQELMDSPLSKMYIGDKLVIDKKKEVEYAKK